LDAAADHHTRPVLVQPLAKGPAYAAGLHMGATKMHNLERAAICGAWVRSFKQQAVPRRQELGEVLRTMEGSAYIRKATEVAVPVDVSALPECGRIARL
jgi:hypothetical protein